MTNLDTPIEDPGLTSTEGPGSQLSLPLEGEVDLESIRRTYESEQLWDDARHLARKNGYSEWEKEDLTQDLVLEGLQCSKRFKLKTEGGRSLRTYVIEMMKMKLPRFIDKIERSRLPISVSRADHQIFAQITRDLTSHVESKNAWIESGAGRTGHGFDLLQADLVDEWDDEIGSTTSYFDEPEIDLDTLLDGEQLELWSVLLDDEDTGRHGLGKKSVIDTYTLSRAWPEWSDVKIGQVMGHDGKWVRRRLDRAGQAIAEFYKLNPETIP